MQLSGREALFPHPMVICTWRISDNGIYRTNTQENNMRIFVKLTFRERNEELNVEKQSVGLIGCLRERGGKLYCVRFDGSS